MILFSNTLVNSQEIEDAIDERQPLLLYCFCEEMLSSLPTAIFDLNDLSKLVLQTFVSTYTLNINITR